MARISLFMGIIFLIGDCFAQKQLAVIDPIVESALHKWADSLRQTISALRQEKINEAVEITCKELDEESKLSPLIWQSFNIYTTAMIDYPLRIEMFNYYFKAGGMLGMPNKYVYSIAFADLLCRTSWCKLQEQTLCQYEMWQKTMTGIKNDPSDAIPA